ncbi:MAG: dehydratase [Chloroflexi bacterium]|nr:dehydratase [Chloroflexota bacterium]HCU79937.1 dehydratase [Chloroflexota bacterium]|tara:strand:+ start:484 stop:945 length:462 start_codon:yes stop_codon:yes gene_type:complete
MNSADVRGLYFEQYEIGMEITSQGRTITEADINAFAGLSGDFNQIHTDEVYASNSAFGQRVAHGLLVTSIVSGLAVQTGFMEGTVIAFREISQWKFSNPVFIGDTVTVVIQVTNTKKMSRLNGGAVTFNLNVYNQSNSVVQRGEWVILLKSQT